MIYELLLLNQFHSALAFDSTIFYFRAMLLALSTFGIFVKH